MDYSTWLNLLNFIMQIFFLIELKNNIKTFTLSKEGQKYIIHYSQLFFMIVNINILRNRILIKLKFKKEANYKTQQS